jgi:hypothetical protein
VYSKNGEFHYLFKEDNAEFVKKMNEKEGVTVELYSEKGELVGKSTFLIKESTKKNK